MKRPLVCVAAVGAMVAAAQAGEAPLEGTAFVRGETRGPNPVTYYLAPAAAAHAPLLVVLQGSGCGALFSPTKEGFQATAGQDIVHQLGAGRFAVLVVEKPGVAPETSDEGTGGVSEACSAEFRAQHALDPWAKTVSRAIDAARKEEAVDARAPVRLLGLSEGSIVAARVSALRVDVSHVAFISGFGCDQWSDMLVVARRNAEAEFESASLEEREAAVAKALKDMEAGFAAIAQDPANPDRYFDDQTHLFWSTFGKACPAADLAKTDANVFVALGTADEQVDANGVEAIPAARIAAGKPITMRRILGGGHILSTPERPGFDNLVGVFSEAIDWMAPTTE